MMLRQLATDLWLAERTQRFWGLEVGTRMTVVRLADGGLLLHSIAPLSPEIRAEVDALGPVRCAVAPNRFHHLHAGDVRTAYPEASLWLGPGLKEKRPDLSYGTTIEDDAEVPWRGDVDHRFFRGRPMENEVVFFHRASRTLVLCDLAMNFGPSAPWFTRATMTVLGGYGEFRPTRLDPLLIRDREAARACMEHILAWDFDRVILGHGDVLESGGKDALARGYHWLLDR